MNLKSKKGFTLVELIIVIAILGIIALIAVPSLTGVQKRSQINADIRTAEQIGKAVRIWLTDANINEANKREGHLEAAWRELSTLATAVSGAGDMLDKYIPTTYVPQALIDSEFYIKLDGNNRINVAIDTSAPGSTEPTAEYKMGTNDAPTAGMAYIEGVSNLTEHYGT